MVANPASETNTNPPDIEANPNPPDSEANSIKDNDIEIVEHPEDSICLETSMDVLEDIRSIVLEDIPVNSVCEEDIESEAILVDFLNNNINSSSQTEFTLPFSNF